MDGHQSMARYLFVRPNCNVGKAELPQVGVWSTSAHEQVLRKYGVGGEVFRGLLDGASRAQRLHKLRALRTEVPIAGYSGLYLTECSASSQELFFPGHEISPRESVQSIHSCQWMNPWRCRLFGVTLVP